ncbi:Gamma-glutamyl hydrolase [Lamellibrachia satsuma]|nr:Gamma-glutamyl hydrolase [Lamellibrachia satsuma]
MCILDRRYDLLFRVLFPGGAANVTDSPFAKVGRFFYEKAMQSNDKGDYFPLWGTCLGFELLADLTAEDSILKRCHADNILMPLRFTTGFFTKKF